IGLACSSGIGVSASELTRSLVGRRVGRLSWVITVCHVRGYVEACVDYTGDWLYNALSWNNILPRSQMWRDTVLLLCSEASWSQDICANIILTVFGGEKTSVEPFWLIAHSCVNNVGMFCSHCQIVDKNLREGSPLAGRSQRLLITGAQGGCSSGLKPSIPRYPPTSFSSLNLLKSYMRNSTNEDRLNGLHVQYIHPEVSITDPCGKIPDLDQKWNWPHLGVPDLGISSPYMNQFWPDMIFPHGEGGVLNELSMKPRKINIRLE
ncbi:unnamed protein product, partial [Timema podura]|nr:unnamed protein product [Timema podura]